MKLFELPIYAVSQGQLYKKYLAFELKFRKEMTPYDLSDDTYRQCLELNTYPQRLWDYNHIVGCIRISLTQSDVMFDIFLPTPGLERYRWRSKEKRFLYNISASGSHFYVGNKSSEDIQKMTVNILNGVIKDHIPPRYFVDREVFDNLNNQIDYKALMEDEQYG